MERLTDPAQGYCEIYCKKYGHCFGGPGDCIFEKEIAMYDALKSIEGIVPFDRLLELALADKEDRLVALPCKVGDTVWLLQKKCKHAGEKNTPWKACNQYWNNVYTKGMWGCAGKDDEGNKIQCEKKEMEWYAMQTEYSLMLCAPHIVLGKNLFLTREEAEAALAGEGGKHETD